MAHQKNGIHDLVKEKYSAIAQGKRGLGASSCCGGPTPIPAEWLGPFHPVR